MAQMDRTHDDMRMNIQKALDEKGDNYVIAALIEGSIGYHTHDHAKRIVADFRNGEEKCYCERAAALYNYDLLLMVDDDVRLMQRIEEFNPDRVKHLIAFTEATSKLDSEKQETLGLMFPTLG